MFENYDEYIAFVDKLSKQNSRDPVLIQLASRSRIAFLNPKHPFSQQRRNGCVYIIEQNETSALIADALGLKSGLFYSSVEVSLSELSY